MQVSQKFHQPMAKYYIIFHTGVEVAHIASLLDRGCRVIAYGVLPVQVESLKRNLHTQQIDSILSTFNNTHTHTHKL